MLYLITFQAKRRQHVCCYTTLLLALHGVADRLVASDGGVERGRGKGGEEGGD